jgi:1-phosphofructokinase family hexose kinase
VDNRSPRVVVACPNIAIDRTLRIPLLRRGAVLRSSTIAAVPGGKGANVARIATSLGAPVCLLTILAGHSGKLFGERLAELSPSISLLAVPAGGESRTNLALLEDAGSVTVINDHGSPIDDRTWTGYEELLATHLSHDDVLVCTGSLPPGAPPDGFAKLLEIGRTFESVRSIVDASGPALERSLAASPTLVSPNLEEAESVTGRSDSSSPEERPSSSLHLRAKTSARRLVESGAGAAVVSIGESGLLLADAHTTYGFGAPNVSVASAVGAGDALVAGIATAWLHDYMVIDSVIVGTAVAGASVEQNIAGIVSRERAGQLCRAMDKEQLSERTSWFL